MSLQIEHTDTYSGEANYSWVNRWHVKDTGAPLHERTTIKLAKKLAGLTGVPCRKEKWGDGTIALYPRRICSVVFVSYGEPGYARGQEVDRDGEPAY